MANFKSNGTTQCAALPLRLSDGGRRQVMLLSMPQNGDWVIPKGWPMKGRKPAEAAARAALEKAGLIGQIVGKRPIGDYHELERPARAEVLLQIKVFLFRVERQLDDWPEKNQWDTRWFDAEAAAELVQQGGLAEIIDRFSGSYVRFIAFRK